LLINLTNSYIYRVFRETAKSGNLGMNDFIRAYQKIYTHTSNQSTNSTKKTQHNTEFICATRYGVHVYEIFTGTNKSNTIIFNQRKTYKNINFLDVLDETVRDDMDEYFDIKDINMTMSDINKLILNDSINNVNISEYSEAAYWQHKVYWWIDIAMKQVTTGNVEKYIPEFGLPNDAKFKSSFAQFNKALPKNIKNHVYIATGESTRERTSSLSLFTQTMFLRNVPIVQCVPNWFHKVLPTTVINYYMTRFAFFFSNSLPSSHSVNEFNAAYEGANQIAQVTTASYFILLLKMTYTICGSSCSVSVIITDFWSMTMIPTMRLLRTKRNLIYGSSSLKIFQNCLA
jgi:hypothetical protein